MSSQDKATLPVFILRSCLLASPGFDVYYEALTLSFLLVGEAGNEKPFFSCSSRARFLHWKYFLILLEDCLELLTSPGLVRARALCSAASVARSLRGCPHHTACSTGSGSAGLPPGHCWAPFLPPRGVFLPVPPASATSWPQASATQF